MTLCQILEEAGDVAARRRRWRNDEDHRVCVEMTGGSPCYYVSVQEGRYDRGPWTPTRLDLLADDWEVCEPLSRSRKEGA